MSITQCFSEEKEIAASLTYQVSTLLQLQYITAQLHQMMQSEAKESENSELMALRATLKDLLNSILNATIMGSHW